MASLKVPSKLVEPKVGRQANPSPLLVARPTPPNSGSWLIYKLPDWIHDDVVRNCMICNVRFSILNRRHHCRACGGIYCSACAKESWILPQFGVSTPERLCKSCIETQIVVFDLHSKLNTIRTNLASHNQRYEKLMKCAPKLQVGQMFTCYLDGSMKPRKLALSDDLKMIALINTRSNKVTNAYHVTDVVFQPGYSEEALTSITEPSLCLNMACADQVFTLQSASMDHYQFWLEGVNLAQEMVNHTNDVNAANESILLLTNDLDVSIQSQITFAHKKVFHDETEVENSNLTLVEPSDDVQPDLESDSDSFKVKRDQGPRNSIQPGILSENDNDLQADEFGPPAALKMGRSVPRASGSFMPHTRLDSSASGNPTNFPNGHSSNNSTSHSSGTTSPVDVGGGSNLLRPGTPSSPLGVSVSSTPSNHPFLYAPPASLSSDVGVGPLYPRSPPNEQQSVGSEQLGSANVSQSYDSQSDLLRRESNASVDSELLVNAITSTSLSASFGTFDALPQVPETTEKAGSSRFIVVVTSSSNSNQNTNHVIPDNIDEKSDASVEIPLTPELISGSHEHSNSSSPIPFGPTPTAESTQEDSTVSAVIQPNEVESIAHLVKNDTNHSDHNNSTSTNNDITSSNLNDTIESTASMTVQEDLPAIGETSS